LWVNLLRNRCENTAGGSRIFYRGEERIENMGTNPYFMQRFRINNAFDETTAVDMTSMLTTVSRSRQDNLHNDVGAPERSILNLGVSRV
jgi:hypothetical protein